MVAVSTSTSIVVAIIGAVTAVSGAFLTAQSTANTRVNQINTEVKVLQERQELQYLEIKEGLSRLEDKLDVVLK